MKKCDILNAKNYDAIIIGFGKGGKTLAGFLANKGKKVALVEKDKKMYGGTCINVGCIPTKILVEESQKVDKKFKKAIEKKDELTSKLREINYNKLNLHENIDIYTGIGAFESEHIISVTEDENEIVLNGNQIFINTGSKTIIPKIDGLKTTRNIYTSTSIMELNELPKKLAVIGGGYIGLEFSSIYNNFGSEVIIFEGNEDILLREEMEIREEVKENFKTRGIQILSKSKVLKLSNYSDNQVEIVFNQDEKENKIVVDGVLIAVGRVPNIDDFRIIKNNLFGDKTMTTEARNIIPYSVFISPTLSKVGLSEKEAINAGYKVKTKVIKASTIPRAKLLGDERGVLKAVVDEKNGKILGCSLYSTESSEVINVVAMAIKENKEYTYLRDFVFTHPTMSEALNDLFDF